MFQTNFTIANKRVTWFLAIEDILKEKLAANAAVMAYKQDDMRVTVSIACENQNKTKVVKVLKDCLVEMYAVAVKLDYIKRNLKLHTLEQNKYNILLHTLVAFDRENERDLINRAIIVTDTISLDGIFNFSLASLRTRWNEVCKLTMDNAEYLNDDSTFNELLRFLISAVNPKIMRIVLKNDNGAFNLKSDKEGEFEATIADRQQLMYYLIDIAPLELVIDGRIEDKALLERLVNMFDAKQTAVSKYKI